MKLAILTSSYPRFPGDGVGSFIQSLAGALAALEHRVCVLAPYDPAVRETADAPGDPIVKRFRYVRPDRLAMVGHARSLEADVQLKGPAYLLIPLWSLAAIAHLVDITVRHKIDVLYAQWVLPSGLIAAIVSQLTGRPLVIHLHGSDVYVAAGNLLFRRLARWSFERASAVIACSDDLRDRSIQMGLTPEKSQVIPYGVDTMRYQPARGDDGLRSSLGVPSQAPLIMAMGRLVYKKGFEFLLRAAPQVLAVFPEARFAIAGDGDLAQGLVDLAANLGVGERVIFLGHIPWQESHRYLQLADVLVVPSVVDPQGNVDGLPNVLLEGMSCGRPIVASRVAGIPSVVHDGENGLLVPEKDPASLATAIIHLLQSPELGRMVSRAARETVVSELDWSNTASRVADVLASAKAGENKG